MRDIYYKPSVPTEEPALITQKPASTQKVDSHQSKLVRDSFSRRLLNRIILIAKYSGDKLSGYLVEPVNVDKPISIALKEKKSFKKLSIKTPKFKTDFIKDKADSIKNKGRVYKDRAVRNLRTPLAKVTIIQSCLVVGMFTYLAFRHAPDPENMQPRSAKDSFTTLRAFLPSSSDVAPAEFSEADAISSTSTKLHAWVTPWNIQSLDKTTQFTSLSAFWATLQTDSYSIQPKAEYSEFSTFIASNNIKTPTYLTITGDPEKVENMLINENIRRTHIEELLRTVEQNNFAGIDIDYEGLGSGNRDLFTRFIDELTTRFHQKNKMVAVTLECRIGNQVPMDWAVIGKLADQIRIMAYDYHASTTGFPGPIAPLGWIKEVVGFATSTIDSKKLIVGLGNYGYDWTEPTGDNESWEGIGLSFNRAITLASEKGIPITRSTGIDDRGYDIGATPNFLYTDENGKQHSVWFEDNDSLRAKIQLISQYQTAGVIFWSVGAGDSTFWQTQAN